MAVDQAKEIVRALRDVFDARAAREADIKPARVVGRNTDGSALLLGLDGECISRGGAGGYNGELVVQLPSLLNREGTVGVGVVARRSTAVLLMVDSIDPAAFARGSSLDVLVTGVGFSATTVFQFLLPESEDVNPGITINSTTFVDSANVTLNITVASDAELLADQSAPLAFDDPAMRF
ncbi:MAG: hypothetical protein ABIU84_06760 [Thermoanaerobaculia bacterium]